MVHVSVLTRENGGHANNDESKEMFQKPNVIVDITRKILMWAGHVWREEDSFVKAVLLKIIRPGKGRNNNDVKAVEPTKRTMEIAVEEDGQRWR